MSKRFTATEKWDDPWFCALSAEDKLFWFYLLDKCDHAGIWQVNWLLASFHIPGLQPKTGFHNRVKVLNDNKWFIPKFVEFQYGTLDPNNRAHNSVIKILQKQGAYKPLTTPLQGRKDMDMDKDKDKDSGKPVNWGNCKSDLQSLMAHYIQVEQPEIYKSGTQAQVNALFKRYGRAASELLVISGDLTTAKRVFDLSAAHYAKKGLSWNLSTVVANAGDFLNVAIGEKRNVCKR